MARYDRHRVTTKAALYIKDSDGAKLLAVQYKPESGSRHFGLPGGHVDRGETPNQAIERELSEELGLKGVKLRQISFDRHSSGKLVLGYIGKLDSKSQLNPPEPSLEAPAFFSRQEFARLEIDESYRRLGLDNWPR